MSRIGKLPIAIPTGVTVEKRDGNLVAVKGPKGELSYTVPRNITVQIADNTVTLTRGKNDQKDKSMHGLSRTLVANMVQGVTKGFSKQLEIQGVGYRASMQGSKLVLALGYSHPIELQPPAGIQITIDQEKKNILTVTGADKQQVGEVAAKIRGYRKPEPYKGKGIRYLGEHIVRKAGKAAAKEK